MSNFRSVVSLTELVGDGIVIEPSKDFAEHAHVKDIDTYRAMYKKSVEDPEAFWGEISKEFYWKKHYSGEFMSYNFDSRKGKIFIKFMEGAQTNICYNVLDRIVKEKGLGKKIAFYWEGNELGDSSQITYKELFTQVCHFSNALRQKGVTKGDRVAIYMPMVIELVVAVLSCARIGAIHSVVFAGFSADSLAERMLDGQCSLLVTTDGFFRGKKFIELKAIADDALDNCVKNNLIVKTCIVSQHTSQLPLDGDTDGACTNSPPPKRHKPGYVCPWNPDRDVWWHEVVKNQADESPVEWMDAEDPLFMLYTSGSTGKPKGVLHTVAGYMLYTATTFKYVFDYKDDDVYWCTADIGWITGHSYVIYGPMAHGATSVMFEGVPLHPDAGRCWDLVDKYGITKFYTAPTLIRSLMKFDLSFVTRYSRKSLQVLGTVGEPINPEAWLWYHKHVGDGRCSVVDTFWQTETGGHVITGLPGATPMKPGSASFPFFGVVPAIVDEEGKELTGECDQGFLVFKRPWPGMMRTLYGNHERFQCGYFDRFHGYYCAGDGCSRDADGYYWITGRIDDLMNVSGHLLSTAQIESALIEHTSVAEAAVVSMPHRIKGECVYCYVTLRQGENFNEELVKELKSKVRQRIGAIASPEYIQNAPGLPKTRSGKIMRRVLRKIAKNDKNLGDITTMADPTVVEELFKNRPHIST